MKREFFDSNIEDPLYLIISYSLYMDLKIELFDDFEMAISNQLSEFEGMKICVINDPVENTLHVTK